MAAKSRKKHQNQISGLVISMGYETEIREFWLFTRLSSFRSSYSQLKSQPFEITIKKFYLIISQSGINDPLELRLLRATVMPKA